LVGTASLLMAFGALYLAFRQGVRGPATGSLPTRRGWRGRLLPRRRAAAAPLGAEYAIAALLAGVIPGTAIAVVIATTREKSLESDERLHDTAADDREPFPGIGLDDSTPLDDTPEVHGDLRRHDLPKGHPARRAAEQQSKGTR
jgi:hypothetical protein